jgi:protein-disulfide isomerase
MRYFWQSIIGLGVVSAIIFLFFVFSVRVGNNINFTDADSPTAPLITIADPSVGPATAAVTIVDYGDYGCLACSRLDSVLQNLSATYGNRIRIVWKDMPNSSAHSEAIDAAVAARCAGKQNKFWEYHNLLMQNQTALSAELYTTLASTLKLKASSFANCVNNQETLALVERGFDEGAALKITATPTLWINGERYSGDLTERALSQKIDSLLEK